MNSILVFFFVTVLIRNIASFFAPAMAAHEFKVGDGGGWRQPAANETEIYTHWAAGKKFHIGDSLRFEYKSDSLMVVDKRGYYHCNSTHPVLIFKDGNTVINLDRPGPNYFVSADPEHCKHGQRLMVDVISPHRISRSPPAPFMAASPAPSPISGSGSFSFGTELVFFYAVLTAVSIIM